MSLYGYPSRYFTKMTNQYPKMVEAITSIDTTLEFGIWLNKETNHFWFEIGSENKLPEEDKDKITEILDSLGKVLMKNTTATKICGIILTEKN